MKTGYRSQFLGFSRLNGPIGLPKTRNVGLTKAMAIDNNWLPYLQIIKHVLTNLFSRIMYTIVKVVSKIHYKFLSQFAMKILSILYFDIKLPLTIKCDISVCTNVCFRA